MKKIEVKDKKKYIVRGIVLILLGISLFILNIVTNDKNKDPLKEEVSDSQKFKTEYESLNNKKTEDGKTYPSLTIDKDNPIKYITNKQVIQVIKEGSGIIYFGFKECPWCRNALPSLLSAAKEKNINQIYYFNPKDDRNLLELDKNGKIITKEEGTKEYKEMLELLKDYLKAYDGLNDNSIKRLYVPFVLFIQNGKVVGYHSETVDTQTDPYQKLTDTQFNELKNIYISNIDKVYNSECVDEC